LLLKRVVFWRKTRIILNENILTSGNNKINKSPLWFWDGLTRLTYPHADAIIVPSIAGKQDLISRYRIKASKIRVCVNWTLTKKITPQRKKYDLIYLGRLEKEKNPLALVKLIVILKKTFPQISLCVVGIGSYESEMRFLSRSFQLENNIIFLGYRSDVSRLLSQSKILVMTTMNEGLPIAILEAGMQDVPCITTRFLGSDEVIIHNKSGIICDSLQDISTSIRMLLSNSSILKRFGKNSYKHISLNFGKKAIEDFTRRVLDI
jgi:glycosyltransferase involved in cell wall biosynthesis